MLIYRINIEMKVSIESTESQRRRHPNIPNILNPTAVGTFVPCGRCEDREIRDSRRDHRVTVIRSRLLDWTRSLALSCVPRIASQVFPISGDDTARAVMPISELRM